MKRYAHILGPLLGILLLGVAAAALFKKLSMFSLSDIERDIRHISTARIIAAIVLTDVYYTLITGYDTLAFRFIRHPLPYRRIALAAFTGYAFSHNVGFTAISSGSVRYRIHSSFGLTAKETAKIVAFSCLSFWIGFLSASSVIFLLLPMNVPHILHLPFQTVRIFGLIALALLLLYGWYTTHARHGNSIGKFELPALTPKIFAMQMLIGSLDWILASAILFILLPHAGAISYPRFFEMFLLAQIAGLASQIPGGIGVFEGVMLAFLPKRFPVPTIIGALLIYRLIFYVLPLIVATILLATHEVRMTGGKREQT